jgi:small GTP-binding protein
VNGRVLERTLRGHSEAIATPAWSPDGRYLATASRDTTVRVFEVATGETLRVLRGHDQHVLAAAWSRDGSLLATASADTSIVLWRMDPADEVPETRLEGHDDWVRGVVWTREGTLLSASDDGTVRHWRSTAEGWVSDTELVESDQLHGIALAPDGRWLATASIDGRVLLQNREGVAWSALQGHDNYVESVSWMADGRLISASHDRTVRIWDVDRASETNVLEAHTSPVTSCSLSCDGAYLATRDLLGSVRLWRSSGWDVAEEWNEGSDGNFEAGVSFSPTDPGLLATLAGDDREVTLWRLDSEALEAGADASDSVYYVTTKIVLVGDQGVGKTGLGWRLAHGEFKEQSSTHGQQFWVVDGLSTTRADGAECEAVLWDLAGQPDYRLTHALFLDDAELALVLFDPQRQETLSAVDYWLRTLTDRSGRRARVILVGARIDRGGLVFTEEDVADFRAARNLEGRYIATSAATGEGVRELLQEVEAVVDWDSAPATTSTTTFKRIKQLVLSLKETHEDFDVLPDLEGVGELLEHTGTTDAFTDGELESALSHLAKHGYVQLLRTSAGDVRVLLAPELLNNLASSIVLEARRNPDDLGALDERRLFAGDYAFPELAGLTEEQQEILLDAAVRLFVEHNIAFRHPWLGRTYLVFPELINRRPPAPAADGNLEEGTSYSLVGATENVYAALVVLLGYTGLFADRELWHDRAEYDLGGGEICGLRQVAAEGDLELVVYYSRSTTEASRALFQNLLERFLAARDLTVLRFPTLLCTECGYPQDRQQVKQRMREQRGFIFCTECGHKLMLETSGEQVVLAADPEALTAGRHAVRRTMYEAVAVLLAGMAAQRPAAEGAPRCFISYAWGVPEHERWVEKQLAPDLEKVGASVILDRWDNARIGSDIGRFISEIAEADFIVVVGTPGYVDKYRSIEEQESYVAAEFDLITRRITGKAAQRRSVLPVLLDGDEETAFPPLLQGKAYADFRGEDRYWTSAFDLAITIQGLDIRTPAVAELRERLAREA